MSSFSLKNNLTIDNNKYLSWINHNGNLRYNLIGLNTSNNLIINPPNDLIINNNDSANVYINSIYARNNLYSDCNITLLKNKYIVSNNSEGSADGFLGISSSLTTSGSSRIILYGNNSGSLSGTINIYSGQNTNSSLNFYNNTSCSLSITNNIINLHNKTYFSNLDVTIGNSVLFSNTTNSLSSTSGSIIIVGGVGIGGNVSLTGKLIYTDTTVSTNYTSASLVLGGGLSISNTSAASDINNGGALSIAGGVSIGKNTLIGGNVILYNNNSSSSTSSFNANLVVYGGLGINDTMYLRSNDSQIKIAPLTNNNPTTIEFYNQNDYTGNKWILGQSNGNFSINSNGTGTNGTIVAVQNISCGNFYFTGELYKNGTIYSGIGTGADSSGNLTLSNLVVDNINIGISNVFSGSFNAANNVSTPTAIPDLIFSGSLVISFVINASVVIYTNNVATLYETFTLSGSYSSTGWILTDFSVGDISGIRFSINTSSGQIYYTSTNTPGYTSSIIRYYTTTNNVNGSYRNLSLNTTGNNAITSTIILTDTTDSVYGSSIGSLYSFGGVTINKSIIGGALNITGTSTLTGSVTTGALASTLVSSGSIGVTGATVGTLYATTITSANIQASGTISTGTLTSTSVTTGNISAAVATIGTLYATTITTANIQASGTISTGTLTSTSVTTGNISAMIATTGVLNASGITVGNLNFTGGLYQNGSLYQGSQWTTTVGNVSYTSGSVVASTVSASNIISTTSSIGTLYATTFNPSSINTTSVVSTNMFTNNATIGSLYVYSYVYQYFSFYFMYNGGTGSSNGTNPYSVIASQRIAATEFNAYSDQRIKKNIVDIDDGLALEIIRKIQPKCYNYIDQIRGTQPVWGFIAQQVKSVLDYSVDTMSDYIPNIYNKAQVTQCTSGSILVLEAGNTNILDSTKAEDGNIIIKIYFVENEHEYMKEVYVKEILNTNTLRIDYNLNVNEVFVFGQKINDFHTLNKDAIFTVSVAALQEVDRELQSAKETIAVQQGTIDTLNQQIQDILSRLQNANIP